MKKIISLVGFCWFCSFFVIELKAACYEPTYPALECDTQGFDSCVNYPKEACEGKEKKQ